MAVEEFLAWLDMLGAHARIISPKGSAYTLVGLFIPSRSPHPMVVTQIETGLLTDDSRAALITLVRERIAGEDEMKLRGE